MAVIHPFRGVRYAVRAIGNVGAVLAPPYDAIAPDVERALLRASPYNVVRVELGARDAADRYEVAAATLTAWREAGVVLRDAEPSLYVSSISAGDRERIGLTARARLVDLDDATLPTHERILRHERTLSGPKEDRLRMLRATRMHTSSVFALVDDPANEIGALLMPVFENAPVFDVTDIAGVHHRLWVVNDPVRVSLLTEAYGSRAFLIADGHHRYETALHYRDERRADGTATPACDDVMLYVCRMQDAGLHLLGYHRSVHLTDGFVPAHVLARIREAFDVIDYGPLDGAAPSAALAESLVTRGSDRTALAVAVDGRQYLFVARAAHASDAPLSGTLDTSVLERDVLTHILGLTPDRIRGGGVVDFHHDAGDAFALVARGAAQMAFVLNPVDVHTVARIAAGGEVMPQKSTWFSPKVPTGLVMNPLDD